MASQVPPVKGVAFDLYFHMFKNDGTVIANPGGLAGRVANATDSAGAATDNAPSCIDTTGGCCKLILSIAEMDSDWCEVKVTSTDTGAVPFTCTIYTTGHTDDDTYTAISGIGTAGGAAVNTDCATDNYGGGISGVTSATTKVGTQTGGFANTTALDATYSVMAHATQVVDIVYQFLTGGGTTPVACVWTGVLNPNNDTVNVWAWKHTAVAGWEKMGVINGQNSTTANIVKNIPLYPRHVGTSAAELGKVYIRLESSAAYNHSLKTDQIYVTYAITSRSIGYADGAVWVKATGTAGTELYVNGTADNPCPWANALTIAASLGITRFRIKNGELITLDATATNLTLIGKLWALNLAGQVTDECYFEGASVYGTCSSSATKTPFFKDCKLADIAAMSTNAGYFVSCMVVGSITLSEAGNYTFDHCIDGTPGGSTNPILIFTSGAILAGLRSWSGGLQLNTLTSDSTVAIEGAGRLVIHTDCHHGGTIIVRGPISITDNSTTGGGTPTLGFEANGGLLTQSERLSSTDLIEDILRNKLTVDNSTGAGTLYADNSTTALLTNSITDNSTLTVRTRLA
jgi:hypothetical protein